MFFYFLIFSWVLTLGVWSYIRGAVANYQECQIGRGQSLVPASRQGSVPKTSTDTDMIYEQSRQRGRVESVTERELYALQKTPTFQLWAENKTRQIARHRLVEAQRTLSRRIVACVVLFTAVVFLPFTNQHAHGAGNENSVLRPRRLFEILQHNDVVYAKMIMRKSGQLLSINHFEVGSTGDSTIQLTPFRLIFGFALAAFAFGVAISLTRGWRRVKALSTSAHSLVSFMATTNHNASELARQLNTLAAGGKEDAEDERGKWYFLLTVSKVLLILGVLLIRFSQVAATSFVANRNGNLNDTMLLLANIESVGIEGKSIGFVVTTLATMALICV